MPNIPKLSWFWTLFAGSTNVNLYVHSVCSARGDGRGEKIGVFVRQLAARRVVHFIVRRPRLLAFLSCCCFVFVVRVFAQRSLLRIGSFSRHFMFSDFAFASKRRRPDKNVSLWPLRIQLIHTTTFRCLQFLAEPRAFSLTNHWHQPFDIFTPTVCYIVSFDSVSLLTSPLWV